jgi:GT2 family glycosyltransferase
MHGEDLDLCFRIRKWVIRYFTLGTSIIHHKGESTKSSLSYVNNFYSATQIFVKRT